MKLKGDQNSATLFELRPDHFLIDAKFQGYKLSLETLPVYVVPIECQIDHAAPTDDQYSLQHVKLAALNNHIFPDPWNPSSVYIVDHNWIIYKIGATQEKAGQLSKIWTIPANGSKQPGRFNITMIFPDDGHAVIADGCGTIYILETNSRNSEADTNWKVVFHQELFASKKNFQFIILDSILYQEGTTHMDILLLRIDERAEWKEFLEFHQDKYLSSSEHPFVSVLEWITLAQDESKVWSLESKRCLVGRSGVDYATIEPNGTALYLASDDPYYFAYDSKNPVQLSNAIEAGGDSTSESDKSDYVWFQNGTQIRLWFRLPEESKKFDFTIDISANDIHIEYKKQVMLSGKLFDSVKPDESNWTLESGKLEVSITKSLPDAWKELIPGNTVGEEIHDPELVEQIHSQLAHMCSDKWGADPHKSDVYDPQQLEECDAYPADTALLMRIDRTLQKITNQASLGSHKWLFNVRTDPKSIPSMCIRHDVDGIIWQPDTSVNTIDGAGDTGTVGWNCKHIGTFSALGYVQASKESRKFTVSAPDLSYVAICDSVKHIHVYRQPSQLENDLRNRKTGTKVSHIARQQVIALDPPLEVMGAYAGNEFLYVLTSKNLHLIRMNEPENF